MGVSRVAARHDLHRLPWLTLGYAHSDSPLAGYAPVLGVYGVSLVAAVSAGLLAWLYIVGAGHARDQAGRGMARSYN